MSLHRASTALLALLLAFAPTLARAQAELKPWTGPAAAPPIALNTLDGAALALADLRGKVVVVNFWATWCEPCVEEMPSLQRLREKLRGAPFEILAVNYQEGAPRIRAFLQKVPVEFPIVRDTDGAVTRAWKARVFPSSFVVDGAGKIRYTLVGSIDWSAPSVEKTLRRLLANADAR
ncbi:MAG: TlpA disulfide reductase family protein [Burkholderiaceae bacterium]